MLSFNLIYLKYLPTNMSFKQMSEHTNPNPSLNFTNGLLKGQKLLVKPPGLVIGRDPDLFLQLDSPYVSRRHAEISYERGLCSITDLDSKNGVFVNTVRIKPQEPYQLRHGDQVQIGSVSTFLFHDPEATIHESDLPLKSSGLWVDESNHDVYLYGQRLNPPLSTQQFCLLAALMGKRGDVMRYEEIEAVLWPGASEGVEQAAIDNTISRIRSRLVELDAEHDFIETVRGLGRRFQQKMH
jgi:hypothetical protein